MKYKPDWEQARERMVAYWNHAVIDRCCIAIHAPKDDSTLVHPDIQNGPWLLELDEIPDSNTATIENWWTDPEWNYRRAITWFENTYFAGEALPVTYINWGASSMAAMFGSPPHFNKSSVWYPKVIEDWDTWRWEPNPEATPTWKTILAILDRLVEGAPGNYLVGKPELGNGADILSLIRGMDNLALDLINCPERVIDGVDTISSTWVRLMEEVHARVQPVNCGGDVLAWMGPRQVGPACLRLLLGHLAAHVPPVLRSRNCQDGQLVRLRRLSLGWSSLHPAYAGDFANYSSD
jgi:hypothetical protein